MFAHIALIKAVRGERPKGTRVPAEDHEEIPVCTENLIRVDDVMESPKLAE
jgi:hypothetical protein